MSRPHNLFALRTATFVGALIFSGCMLAPAYKRPAMPVAAEFPAASASSAGAGAAADIAWRGFFTEERLRRLVDLALSGNRDFRVALLNIEQSRAQDGITRSASFPTVDAGGGFTRQHASGITSNQWNANLGVTAYEVDLFGRVRSLNTQALEQYLATAEAGTAAQISLVAEVAIQYCALRQAEEQLVLARQTRVAVQASYDLNKAVFDAGQGSELDLRTAEGQVQTAKINVLTYERQRAQAENALVLLVGRPLPAGLPAPGPFDASMLLADIPAGLPSDLIRRRPDIRQAEHTLKAANASIGAARAAFFPSISLTGSVGAGSSQLSGLFGSGSGVWSFAPSVSVPIFTGGFNRATLDAAQVGARIEVANYEKAIQTAFREVADALVATTSYSAQIREDDRLIAAQQRRLELATVRYRQGDDTYLNVLSAQQDLYGAQQGLLTDQFNRLSGQISLYKALGGGWK